MLKTMTTSKTIRLTTAQAVIRYLKNQHSERDGARQAFFAGMFWHLWPWQHCRHRRRRCSRTPIFAITRRATSRRWCTPPAAYAKIKNRLQTLVCTSSIGPGATNMVTGAALATINRLPVLLLPGDIFARRNVAPGAAAAGIREQSRIISVNDCFKPVSRYWDRINRPDQILTALPEAMRVLTSPAETGAVTLALPQDVQTEALRLPAGLL